MSDASLMAASFAILTEDDPDQKYTSIKKSYALIAYGSKTFTENKIREDVEIRPIKVNLQSAGVSEEDQEFFTDEDDETEEQIWDSMKLSKMGHKVDETAIHTDAISENSVDEITNFTQKLPPTNQKLLEQAKNKLKTPKNRRTF